MNLYKLTALLLQLVIFIFVDIQSPCVCLHSATSPQYLSICCILVESRYTQRSGCVGWIDGCYEWRLKRGKVRLRKEGPACVDEIFGHVK